jgi:multicomponent K+:H+ antiporter subunit A
MVARIILPPALLFAAFLFARGHNLPGGGFVAGLMTAATVILQYVATGREGIYAPIESRRLIGLGLLVAVMAGLGAMLAGQPFLSSAFGHLEVPLLGHLEASTAAIFDLGVFLVVTGVTLTILLAIED